MKRQAIERNKDGEVRKKMRRERKGGNKENKERQRNKEETQGEMTTDKNARKK